MNSTIIITLDYEIFGNGCGDVYKHVIEPTERLMKILNTRNIKMTVFFEIEEFLVFQKYRTLIESKLGYNPVSMIEEQLKEEALVNIEQESQTPEEKNPEIL